jgi:hypothetical protein
VKPSEIVGMTLIVIAFLGEACLLLFQSIIHPEWTQVDLINEMGLYLLVGLITGAAGITMVREGIKDDSK